MIPSYNCILYLIPESVLNFNYKNIYLIMSKVKKANKKAVDEMLSDDSSEVEVPKQSKTKAKKQAEESDSSSESVNMLKQKRKPSKDLKKSKKQKEPSSDSESEEEQTKKAKAKKPTKKVESESSSEEVVISKPKNNKNTKPQKKQDSDDSESEEPVRKPSKASSKKQAKKAKKEESSESESEEVVVSKGNKHSKKQQEEENDEEEENQEIEVVKNNNHNNNHKNHANHDGETHSELFVKNMSYNSTEDSLYEAFSQFGTVSNVKILYDKNSGKSKGIGFVQFESREEATNAMQNVGEVDGRQIQCSWSNDKPTGNAQGGRNDRNQGRQNQGGFQKVDHNGPVHTIFIGNLGFKTSERTVASFFADCGRVVDVRIAKGEDGRSRGFCHLDFDSADAVEKAKGKQNLNLDGREVRVDASEAKGNRQGGGNRGGFGGKPRPPAKQTHPKFGSTGKKVTFD